MTSPDSVKSASWLSNVTLASDTPPIASKADFTWLTQCPQVMPDISSFLFMVPRSGSFSRPTMTAKVVPSKTDTHPRTQGRARGGEKTRAHDFPTWAGATFYYEKVEDRKAWDFALMTVASAARINGGVIEEVRMAVNGAAPVPVRLEDSERIVRGRAPSDALGLQAGEAAVQDAQPLRHNDYKIPLMRNLVRRAVRGMGA